MNIFNRYIWQNSAFFGAITVALTVTFCAFASSKTENLSIIQNEAVACIVLSDSGIIDCEQEGLPLESSRTLLNLTLRFAANASRNEYDDDLCTLKEIVSSPLVSSSDAPNIHPRIGKLCASIFLDDIKMVTIADRAGPADG